MLGGSWRKISISSQISKQVYVASTKLFPWDPVERSETYFYQVVKSSLGAEDGQITYPEIGYSHIQLLTLGAPIIRGFFVIIVVFLHVIHKYTFSDSHSNLLFFPHNAQQRCSLLSILTFWKLRLQILLLEAKEVSCYIWRKPCNNYCYGTR